MAKKTKITIPESNPISETEQQFIDELKIKFAAEIKKAEADDTFLLRFIRGYVNEEPHKEAVEQKLKEYFEWADEIQLKKLAATHFPDRKDFCSKHWPSGLHGISKDGHPIFIDRPGKSDLAVVSALSPDVYKNYHIQTMEYMEDVKRRLSEKTGKRIYKHVAIMDLSGFTFSHFGEKLRGPMKQLVDIDQTKYPETLHALYIINSPFVFRAAWAIASLWVDEITKTRINFIDQEELLKYIDADQLPDYLGGTCKYTEEEPCFSKDFVSGPKRPLTDKEQKMMDKFKQKTPELYNEPLAEQHDDVFAGLLEERQAKYAEWVKEYPEPTENAENAENAEAAPAATEETPSAPPAYTIL